MNDLEKIDQGEPVQPLESAISVAAKEDSLKAASTALAIDAALFERFKAYVQDGYATAFVESLLQCYLVDKALQRKAIAVQQNFVPIAGASRKPPLKRAIRQVDTLLYQRYETLTEVLLQRSGQKGTLFSMTNALVFLFTEDVEMRQAVGYLYLGSILALK